MSYLGHKNHNFVHDKTMDNLEYSKNKNKFYQLIMVIILTNIKNIKIHIVYNIFLPDFLGGT